MELFSIRIQRTFQLVSTQQSIFATENDLTSLKNDMKKTKLENQ